MIGAIHHLNRWVTDRPWLTIGLFTAVTIVLAARIPNLTIDTDVVSLMPKSHPERQAFEWTEDYFRTSPSVLLVVVNEGPDGVFNPSTLSLVSHLSDGLAALEAIDDDIVSLSAVDNIRGDEDMLIVEPFFETPPATREGAREVREAVLENPMMIGRVVTADTSATAIWGEVYKGFDKGVLYDQLQGLVANAKVTSEQVIIAGRPVLDGEWGRLARGDLRRMLPLVLVTVSLLLGYLLRSLRGAILPILVVLTAVVWTLGLMAWSGATFYALATLMPILLIAIGVADGVHVIHYFTTQLGTDRQCSVAETVRHTMNAMATPVIITSITTAAGFGSLSLSPLTSVQSFGLFTAFGVLAAMAFSLTILPALLCILPAPKNTLAPVSSSPSRSAPGSGLADALAGIVIKKPKIIVLAAAISVIAGLSGFPRVNVDGSLIRNFPENNPARRADAELIRYFGGSYPMQVVCSVSKVDGWKSPERLRAVAGLQHHLENLGHTGKTRSLADYIDHMHRVMNVDDPNATSYPTDSAQVAQYLLIYNLSGQPDDFAEVTDDSYQKTCIHALVRADHSPLLKKVISDVESYAETRLAPLGIETQVTGNAKLAYVFIDLITKGQVRSLLVALLLVVLLTSILFASLKLGLLSVIPAAIAVVLNFGVLGWLEIPLGAATAMISSIAIGIGVDFAIHFLVTYRRQCRAGSTSDAAMAETLRTTGTAILYNAVVVFAGFMVLASSSFPPNQALGLLVAMNMIVCLLGTVTVMAALLRLTTMRRSPSVVSSDSLHH